MNLNDFPKLNAAVAARHPDASEKTRGQLCRAALHETAHLFVSLLVGVQPWDVCVRRSGAGWCNCHAHDEREIHLNLAGVAMEYLFNPDYSRVPPAAARDLNDAMDWAESVWHGEAGHRGAMLCGELMMILMRSAALVDTIAAYIVTRNNKASGRLSWKKTHKLNEWVLERLRRTGLGEELGRLRNRDAPIAA